jgi:hypothetical protein
MKNSEAVRKTLRNMGERKRESESEKNSKKHEKKISFNILRHLDR